jgi:hypothetical protein
MSAPCDIDFPNLVVTSQISPTCVRYQRILSKLCPALTGKDTSLNNCLVCNVCNYNLLSISFRLGCLFIDVIFIFFSGIFRTQQTMMYQMSSFSCHLDQFDLTTQPARDNQQSSTNVAQSEPPNPLLYDLNATNKNCLHGSCKFNVINIYNNYFNT